MQRGINSMNHLHPITASSGEFDPNMIKGKHSASQTEGKLGATAPAKGIDQTTV